MKDEVVMKRICLVSFFVLFIVSLSTSARSENRAFVIGEKVSIRSDVLGEDRELFIYLPQDYEKSMKKYPVLYILDGEWHFVHTSGVVQFLSSPGVERIPEMLVVAVVNTARGRDLSPSTWPGYETYTGGADNFLRYFKDELIPYIDGHYRTLSTKILVGHSLAGTFTLYAFLTQPEIFDAYIPLSPCLFWHDRFMMKKAEFFLKKFKDIANIVYIAHEYASGKAATSMQEFVELFRSERLENLRWASILMERETHYSYVHRAIHEGLEFIYLADKD